MKSRECKIEFVDDLETDFEIKAIVFKPEEIKKERYNRAKKKQELERMTRDIVER